jgi:hypothetical protein
MIMIEINTFYLFIIYDLLAIEVNIAAMCLFCISLFVLFFGHCVATIT